MEKLQQLWNAFLDLTAKLVIPDWGALVGLIPIALLASVVLWLVWLAWAYTRVGPRQRGFGRRATVPPPGVHAPGPSFAPFFGAMGTALVLFGLVVGPAGALLGVAALVLALLYWLREGMHEYEHVAGSGTMAITVEHGGPPPGVHVPGPTFLPFTSAVGVAVLLAGLVVGGWMIVAGFICLVIALVGWWRAARLEYRLTEEADRTGHLRNPPAPGFPLRTFALFTIVIVGAAILQAGILPPKGSAGSAGAAIGSPEPGETSGSGPAASAGASGAPGSPPAGKPAADVTIVAQAIAFTTADVTGPAGKPFTIAFENQDQGTPHDVAIRKADGSEAFRGEIFNGVATRVYQVPELPAGQYPFVCTVHSNMTGTLTLK
jgi:plastocyanin